MPLQLPVSTVRSSLVKERLPKEDSFLEKWDTAIKMQNYCNSQETSSIHNYVRTKSISRLNVVKNDNKLLNAVFVLNIV